MKRNISIVTLLIIVCVVLTIVPTLFLKSDLSYTEKLIRMFESEFKWFPDNYISLGSNYFMLSPDPRKGIYRERFKGSADIVVDSFVEDYVFNDDFIVAFQRKPVGVTNPLAYWHTVRVDTLSQFCIIDKDNDIVYDSMNVFDYIHKRKELNISNDLVLRFWHTYNKFSETILNEIDIANSDNELILSYMWDKYIYLNDFEKAIQCCNKLIDLDESNTSCYINIANTYCNYLNDIDSAILILQKYRNLNLPPVEKLENLYFEMLHRRNID